MESGASGSQNGAQDNTEDLTDEQKTADEVFRQMKSSYFTQSEGVRADHCRDVTFGEPYAHLSQSDTSYLD